MRPLSRILWGVSGCLHPHHKIADSLRLWALSVLSIHENCGTSQALCTPMMKSPRVSGFERSAHENCGASQAVCSPMMKIAGSLRLVRPSSRKLWGVSGCLHPHHEIAYSLRLWARSVLSSHQNCGKSQARCTPMMKIADSLRLCAPPHTKIGDVSGSVQPHDENCLPSQALCTPFTKIGGRLRLCAPP